MRIIAGKFKAKKINSPKTDLTRPTLDRVKEALFSIISEYIPDSNVLDLFSGTGNLGLESISRGAKFAWLNDDKNLAISTIISNTLLTNTQNCVKITKKDYMKCLNKILTENIKFNVIFLDPPYDTRYGLNTLKFIDENLGKILENNGIIVYETDKNFVQKMQKSDINSFSNFDNLDCVDERSYSNVVLKMYKWR